MAKVAEQSERYDEMVSYMKEITKHHVQLTLEERNLLSVAFKNLVGARRASWRIVTSIEGKEASNNNTERVEHLKPYRAKIEDELNLTCADILRILDEDVIPFVDSDDKDECNVFYYKMKADYYRYLAEFSSGDKRAQATEDAKKAYVTATESSGNLHCTHPIRLGLALNYSVFMFEILEDRQLALTTAKTAFDEAVSALESLEETSYKDAALIMQLLRDNLSLWAAEDNHE
ncbi:hypothetical protein BGZ52_006687 [Haplosporangium bisporale]|nr:hypothetical protein BGZ52_006687 [Haplosporangium bisporale]